MDIHFCKKNLFTLSVFLIVLCGCGSFIKVSASSIDSYNFLNVETKNFVNRLNEIPQTFTFDKNLRRRAPISPDVQNLKWILNSDTRTALTDNPNMALSELTSAYGPITESAVKKFQTIYRSEILDPQGIKNATGIVGKGTRQKLNWLLSQSRSLYNTANDASVNNANNYNNSNYYTNNYTNNFVDFSNIENFIRNPGFFQTSATTTTNSSATTSTTTVRSTTTERVLYNPTQTLVRNTTNTGNSVNNDNDSSSGALAGLAILGGAALLSGAGNTIASNASQVALSQFGGRIIMNTPCPCSANYMITLYDLSLKMPLSVIFQPGVSSLKMNYNPTVGESVMGGYVRGTGVCLIYVGTGCSPSPTGIPMGTIDTFRGVGTTLTPVGK